MKLFSDDEQFFSLLYYSNYTSISLPNLTKIADSHGIALYPRYSKKKILDKIALNMFLRIDHPYRCLCKQCIDCFFNPSLYLPENSVFTPIVTKNLDARSSERVSVQHRDKGSSKEVRS